MKKQTLDFVRAYADVYGLMNAPFSEVLNIIDHDIMASMDWGEDSNMISPELFVDTFMSCYSSMKNWGLDNEIKESIQTEKIDFFEACREWDIL